MLRRILMAIAALLVGTTGAIAVTSSASASAPHTIVVDLSDPTALPAGVTVESAKTTAPGGVTAALGGCFQEELCVWTDSLSSSQPAGYLYRWASNYKGSTMLLTGTWYRSVSFMQNRGVNTRARVQMSCPYIIPDPVGPWVYYESYKSLAGTLMNDAAKCIVWPWL